MELFKLIRGHFLQLANQTFRTPADKHPFHVDSEATLGSDWQIVCRISTGNLHGVYISDLLRIYTFLINYARDEPRTQAQIQKFVETECVSDQITSYAIPLLATFKDIEVKYSPHFTIRFVPINEG
jgi:hypothetical protein